MGLILQQLGDKAMFNQLFIVDVTKSKYVGAINGEDDLIDVQEQEVGDEQDKQFFFKKRKDLWDPQMHMQLFDEAQALLDDDFMDGINFEEEKNTEWDHVKNMDIWDDQQTMAVFNGGQISTKCSLQENTRIKKKDTSLSLES